MIINKEALLHLSLSKNIKVLSASEVNVLTDISKFYANLKNKEANLLEQKQKHIEQEMKNVSNLIIENLNHLIPKHFNHLVDVFLNKKKDSLLFVIDKIKKEFTGFLNEEFVNNLIESLQKKLGGEKINSLTIWDSMPKNDFIKSLDVNEILFSKEPVLRLESESFVAEINFSELLNNIEHQIKELKIG